jgi:hypothetical protein
MKRTKYNVKFDSFHINNRWKKPDWNRSGGWIYFGFSKEFFSPFDFEYKIHFFGLDFRFWFIRSVRAS